MGSWTRDMGFDADDSDILLTSEADRQAFTGVDLHAFMGTKKVGTLNAVTYSTSREVAPLYACGSPSPLTFVKGKRGIAGSMTFLQLNKHSIIEALVKQALGKEGGTMTLGGLLNGLAATGSVNGNKFPDGTRSEAMAAANKDGTTWNLKKNTVTDAIELTRILVASRRFDYSDQIPPFDLTLAFANEQGATAWMAIENIQFVNEGGGFSLDDMTNEIAVTYVATGIRPLKNGNGK